MPTQVVMPKLGNSVESSIIVAWKKQIGDPVTAGETLLEVETDKATVDVEAPASGTLLAIFHAVGDDVPVMTPIAAIGAAGEVVVEERNEAKGMRHEDSFLASEVNLQNPEDVKSKDSEPTTTNSFLKISPRARKLAAQRGAALAGIVGSGPGGRVIERDVIAALARQPKLTPVAERMVAQGDFAIPDTTAGKRITTRDLIPSKPVPGEYNPPDTDDVGTGRALSVIEEDRARRVPTSDVSIYPLKGIRKTIATRMFASLQSTAQLTMNAFADARALRGYRERLKHSDDALGLRRVTINDLVMYAVGRTLAAFPAVNAHLKDDAIHQFGAVNLGFAVDTPRGLIVPVIHDAAALSLRALSSEAARLAAACSDGTIKPHELDGGTFTVSNLGGLGIETFTPVLNAPQVAILGVGNIALKPVEVGETVQFIPHIGLSLTIDHRAIDGAPGARFLQALAKNIGSIDVLVAV
jgi:pyruvate dehydrogenase E2 component (dihydrolipoamide acetyltransferase)